MNAPTARGTTPSGGADDELAEDELSADRLADVDPADDELTDDLLPDDDLDLELDLDRDDDDDDDDDEDDEDDDDLDGEDDLDGVDLGDDGLIAKRDPRPKRPVGVSAPANGPGVVVVHDWYGPLPHVSDFADELTMAGFDVELVDVYEGVTTRNPGRAEELAEALDGAVARDAIVAAAKRLRAAGSRHVGAVGFSLGGSLVLRAAQRGGIDAVVAYYASRDPDEAVKITCPVQLHLAAIDEYESADDIEAFVAALRAAGTSVDTFRYPGTEHSFANADVPFADLGAAEVALARTIGFLHARLV